MRVRFTASAVAVVVGTLTLSAAAQAAGPPQVDATWATDVTATSASLHAEVNPEGLATTYRFEYLTETAYQANGETFTGAARAPSFGEEGLGSEETDQPALQPLVSLRSKTTYRYRIVATNSSSPPGGTPGTAQIFTTEEAGSFFELPDNRGWEMVSLIDKNGGAIQGFGQNSGGDVLQAAANGSAITYSSSASFGAAAQGAPTASQYIATRHEEEGWSSENITTPSVSGSYGNANTGVPYQLFSTDLARGLLLNGRRCGEGEECPRSYSLRESEGGALATTPAETGLRFAGASPDLRHLVFSTAADLYAWPGGGGLTPIGKGPGSALAAPAGAVSADGQRVYFTDEGNLYLREGTHTAQVDEEKGGGGQFETATPDGSFAFFTKGEHLYRYEVHFEDLSTIDLTPGGEVQGVLGASEDGSRVYYVAAAGLFLWHGGTTTEAAPAADPGNYPPSTGTARVSPDGTHLAFLSKARLTGYDNTDQQTGEPDNEVYLYTAPAGAGEGTLACVSCNPTNERPLGPSTIPGAIANGEGPEATQTYKPRNLSTNGARLFFDSRDALVPQDASAARDVYEWEAQGSGSCQRPGGCLGLISSGASSEDSSFIDASANGSDAFLLSGDSLVPRDPGSVDLYDAREGGGFPEPEKPIECDGDACQSVPSPPEDPAPGTIVPGPPNPPVHFPKPRCPKGEHRVVRHGKSRCVPKRHKKRRGSK